MTVNKLAKVAPAAYLVGMPNNKVDVRLLNKLIVPNGYCIPLYAEDVRADAERYRWLSNHWARVITDTTCHGADKPRTVNYIALGTYF